MSWQGSIIEVISLGAESPVVLSRDALSALETADILIGAEHHFPLVETFNCEGEKILYPSPFKDLVDLLEQYENKKIAIWLLGMRYFLA